MGGFVDFVNYSSHSCHLQSQLQSVEEWSLIDKSVSADHRIHADSIKFIIIISEGKFQGTALFLLPVSVSVDRS